jgi:hypothetical protein
MLALQWAGCHPAWHDTVARTRRGIGISTISPPKQVMFCPFPSDRQRNKSAKSPDPCPRLSSLFWQDLAHQTVIAPLTSSTAQKILSKARIFTSYCKTSEWEHLKGTSSFTLLWRAKRQECPCFSCWKYSPSHVYSTKYGIRFFTDKLWIKVWYMKSHSNGRRVYIITL